MFQFRFSDTKDKLLMFVGFVFACLAGTCVQFNFLILGDVMDLFIEELSSNNTECGKQLSDSVASI